MGYLKWKFPSPVVEVAEKVFNRCVKPNGYPVDHPQYAITLSYEFLDDVSLEWAGFVTSEAADHEETGLDAVMYKLKSALPENASKQVEIKSNHPLMLMVSKVHKLMERGVSKVICI